MRASGLAEARIVKAVLFAQLLQTIRNYLLDPFFAGGQARVERNFAAEQIISQIAP